MAGLYVHFPFCASKCIYCDFYSRVRKDWTPYVEALLKELSDRKEFLKGVPPATLYFGGGTPSLLPVPALSRVADAVRETFGLSSCPAPNGHLPEEFTVEVNPDDVTLEKATALRAMGVSRISMGVQSFHDGHLRWMNRRHSAAQAIAAFETLRRSGFENVSIDLIFGFTGLSLPDWEADITQALALHPEHISCYQMMGRHADPDQEHCYRQYVLMQERLEAAGYLQYEISNFALPGRMSRHNSAYWARAPYLGIGAAAHSFDGNRLRCWNLADIDRYLSDRPGSSETLSDREVFEEKVMLALRTVRGLKLGDLLPEERRLLDKKALEELSRAGKLVCDGASIRIPKEELFVSDGIVARLFP